MSKIHPNLTKVSDEECDAIMAEANEALEKGLDKEIYYNILRRAPISPEQTEIAKQFGGLQKLIDDGVNLSRAVEAYGEKWLTDEVKRFPQPGKDNKSGSSG